MVIESQPSKYFSLCGIHWMMYDISYKHKISILVKLLWYFEYLQSFFTLWDISTGQNHQISSVVHSFKLRMYVELH